MEMFEPGNDRLNNDATRLPKLNWVADFQRQVAWQCFVGLVRYNHDSSSCDLEQLLYVEGVHNDPFLVTGIA
jgi:hypothetical protein